MLSYAQSARAQFVPPEQRTEQTSSFNLGVGIGIDYGGFGLKGVFLPSPRMGLFAGLGYNLLNAGYNVGAEYHFVPGKMICPTLLAMYGYNGVIIVDGTSQYNGTYYGPSIGFGLEVKSKKHPRNFLSFELLFPFREQAYTDAINALKNSPGIQIKSEPWPVAFSFGYHLGF